jgi:hypothetical protein
MIEGHHRIFSTFSRSPSEDAYTSSLVNFACLHDEGDFFGTSTSHRGLEMADLQRSRARAAVRVNIFIALTLQLVPTTDVHQFLTSYSQWLRTRRLSGPTTLSTLGGAVPKFRRLATIAMRNCGQSGWDTECGERLQRAGFSRKRTGTSRSHGMTMLKRLVSASVSFAQAWLTSLNVVPNSTPNEPGSGG